MLLGSVMGLAPLGEHTWCGTEWDSTCGYPGEGPLVHAVGPEGQERIQVDEATGGWLPFTRGGTRRLPSQIVPDAGPGDGNAPPPVGEVPGRLPQSSPQELGKRRRGPRVKRSDRQWSILTTTVTAWQRAEDLLSSFGPGRLQPDVFMVQEIAKTAREAKLLEGQLTNRRWQPQLVPSNVTPDKGKSAGVGVLASWSGTVAAYPVEDLAKRHPG